MSGQADLPELVLGDRTAQVVGLLREIQVAILVHPEAARGLFSALAREGRLFAQTSEGQRWRSRIERSELVQRALLVWQGVSLWTTEDGADASPPSLLVDAIAAAACSPNRDVVLDRLFRQMEQE
jgi:hypothetical protein